MLNKMIYDFAEHGLYYEKQNSGVDWFSLCIETLELECDLLTGKLLGVNGYLPLVKATKKRINLVDVVEKSIFLINPQEKDYIRGLAYKMALKVPGTEKFFNPFSVIFDSSQGVIQIGKGCKRKETLIRVDKNIICGMDSKSTLTRIILIPDEFRNATM